jgi:hypothetical protein
VRWRIELTGMHQAADAAASFDDLVATVLRGLGGTDQP